MTTITEVSISADEFALAETLRSVSDLELRVESVVAEGPSRTMPLVWFSNTDRATLEETLAADPSVETHRRLLEASDGEEWLYRLGYTDQVDDICHCIFDYDGAILDARVSEERWTLRLLFPQREDLSDAMGAVEERGVVTDIRRMVEADQNADLEATAALTDAQQEAISEAYRQGYYDVPREISLEDLATKLDISHQALSERLRRANRVLAGEQIDEPPKASD
ncbi:helix-turn-helix domain-containing protein [Halobacteria archaeon AArc-dxtr1]|nr:helix-turn-helix domain-containing protein [Halobacteria archaeon AArc-dxtr1]